MNACFHFFVCCTALGRQGVYLKPSKRIHPEIYHLKEAMKQAPAGVEIFVDSWWQPMANSRCCTGWQPRISMDIRRKRGSFSMVAKLIRKTERLMPAYNCSRGRGTFVSDFACSCGSCFWSGCVPWAHQISYGASVPSTCTSRRSQQLAWLDFCNSRFSEPTRQLG